MEIIAIISFYYGQSLDSGQATNCSTIAPPGHGLGATSAQEHAEAVQEYADVEHKHAEAEHWERTGHPGRHMRAPPLRVCAPPLCIPAPPLPVPALRWHPIRALEELF